MFQLCCFCCYYNLLNFLLFYCTGFVFCSVYVFFFFFALTVLRVSDWSTAYISSLKEDDEEDELDNSFNTNTDSNAYDTSIDEQQYKQMKHLQLLKQKQKIKKQRQVSTHKEEKEEIQEIGTPQSSAEKSAILLALQHILSGNKEKTSFIFLFDYIFIYCSSHTCCSCLYAMLFCGLFTRLYYT